MNIIFHKPWRMHVLFEGFIGLMCVAVAISLFISFIYYPWVLWLPGSLAVLILLAIGIQAVPVMMHNHRSIKEDIEREKIQAIRDVLES